METVSLPRSCDHFPEDTWIQLYAAGDAAQDVAARIDTIMVDAASTRAPRPAPPAELGPYAKDIAVADVEVLVDLMKRKLLEIEPVEIPVLEELPPRLTRSIDTLWDADSARRQQVSVVATFLHRHSTRRI